MLSELFESFLVAGLESVLKLVFEGLDFFLIGFGFGLGVLFEFLLFF